MLVCIWCLNICKWAKSIKFWKLHEIWTLRFLKNWLFWSNSSKWALFKIFRKFSSAYCFKLCSCKEDHKINMLKKFEQFITISLAVVLVWMPLTCYYSNAQGSTNFSCVQFNGGIQISVQMSVTGKPLLIKCSNFFSGSNLRLPPSLRT